MKKQVPNAGSDMGDIGDMRDWGDWSDQASGGSFCPHSKMGSLTQCLRI